MAKAKAKVWSKEDISVLMTIMSQNPDNMEEGGRQASKILGRSKNACVGKYRKLSEKVSNTSIIASVKPLDVTPRAGFRVQAVLTLFKKLSEEEQLEIIQEAF